MDIEALLKPYNIFRNGFKKKNRKLRVNISSIARIWVRPYVLQNFDRPIDFRVVNEYLERDILKTDFPFSSERKVELPMVLFAFKISM